MPTPRRKASPTQASELWQRLRAARQFADVTQATIAKHLNVSRAAIALHESRNDAIRTRPTAEQIMMISRVTGVPAEFLMSDSVKPEDVWKYADKSVTVTPPAQQPSVTLQPMPPITQLDRRTKGFWSAVEFSLPNEFAQSFARPVKVGEITLTADFYHGKHLGLFCPSAGDHTVAAGYLLLLERTLHRPCTKHLLVWSEHPVPESLARTLADAWGITLVHVGTVEQAVQYLTTLG